jgi:hypothetical protein
MMRMDDGRIDHLQRGVGHSASSEPFQDHVPDAAVGPPPRLPKDFASSSRFSAARRQCGRSRHGRSLPSSPVKPIGLVNDQWRGAAGYVDRILRDEKSAATQPLLLRGGGGSFALPPTGICSFGKSRTLDATLSNAAVASASC